MGRIEMRADIDENGKLIVTAESGVESFALKTWFAMNSEGKAAIQVVTYSDATPSHEGEKNVPHS
jgi:hypothetical protein